MGAGKVDPSWDDGCASRAVLVLQTGEMALQKLPGLESAAGEIELPGW